MLCLVSDIFPMLILYSSGIQRGKDYIVSIVSNDKLHKSNKLREINDINRPSLSLEIQPLNPGDKSLNVQQEYNFYCL